MAEYIEREAAIKAISTAMGKVDRKIMRDRLMSIPAADVRPVVKVKWEEDWETGCSTCSACGESYLWEDYDGVGEWNFCPNCGAMMEES